MFISGSHRKAGGDPLFGSVSLLLHGNGSFADSSVSNLTPTLINTPTIDTTNKKWGSGSMKFVAASNQAVKYPFTNNTAGVFQDVAGTTNGCLEFWTRFTSTNYTALMGAQNGLFGAGAWAVDINYSFTGSIDMWFMPWSTLTPVFTSGGAGSFNDGNWHHVAFAKQGTTFRFFIDGVLIQTQTLPATCAPPTQGVYIGGDEGLSTRYSDCWIDDVRITAGAARYTSAFTPPTAEFPNS